MSSASNIHPSRLPHHHSTRRKKSTSHKPLPPSSSLTRAQLRKKIRDVTRLLSSTTGANDKKPSRLSATARSDLERALTAYRYELEQAENKERRKRMERKYQMVKFFGAHAPSRKPSHG